MSRTRRGAAMLALGAALAAAPAAGAAGGGGKGGGGGGGAPQPCVPLSTLVQVVHADGNGESGVNVQATVRNCGMVNEHMHLNVTIPGSSTVPFNEDLAANPGGSLTLSASPIGSTPLLLRFGRTYNVVATLTETDTAPATVLGTTTTTVTMPAGIVG